MLGEQKRVDDRYTPENSSQPVLLTVAELFESQNRLPYILGGTEGHLLKEPFISAETHTLSMSVPRACKSVFSVAEFYYLA